VENAAGTSCEQDIDYYPYGGVEDDYCITPVPQNYKFTGKERDNESGLDDFDARYYASTMGRFMTPDWDTKPVTVPYAKFGDPQTLDLYGYVENSPVDRMDPTGHFTPPGQEGSYACDGSSGCVSERTEDQEQSQTQSETQDKYGPQIFSTAISEHISGDFDLGHSDTPQSQQQPNSQSSPDPSYRDGVPHATGALKDLLSCTQNCIGKPLMVTSTNEPLSNGKHGPETPHGKGEAADLRVNKGGEGRVVQCAANCGAKYGLDERAHPSGPGVLPHVHIQTVPGTHGGRGDLPEPQD
jgi:RHS repeat-associated protein